MINTEGLSLFGPGSEWFWTMAQFVIVAVTLIGIYFQLRLGRSANNFEQANRLREDLQSERTSRNALAICLALKTGAEPGDLPEGPVSDIQDYWENMAGLVRAGHLETDLIRRGFGNQCQWWWVALEPNIRLVRLQTGNPRAGEEFEWLAGVLAKEDERTESMRALDRAFVMSTLDRSIERYRGRVSLAEEMRMSPARGRTGRPD